MTTAPLRRALDRPAEWQWLDPVAGAVKRLIDALIPRGRLRDTLHGKDIGHPTHPPLAQTALVGWTAAGLLGALELTADGSPDRRSTRDLMAWSSVAAVAPTALSGIVDWSDLHEDQQRTGLVHAVTMTTTTLLSLTGRLARRPRTSAAFDVAAATVATAGAALGGHLAYRWAAGANHAEAFPHLAEEGWTRTFQLSDLADRTPRLTTAGDEPVVVCRVGDLVFALADRCSHLSGPLHEGRVERHGGRDCLVCPWHGSAFQLAGGEIEAGPAISPQPALDVRQVDGWVEVRPRSLPGVAGR
jgi:nitrite reductase/ring-hydroxylating ferredoxin subunit